MADEPNVADASDSEDDDAAEGRQRSTIQFPYADLAAAMEIASAIHDKVGNGECSLNQLAAWLGSSVKSSGFRVQLAAARLFGVIESEGPSNYRLAPLGRRIVDPERARKAKVDAFLNVPLFKRLYENHQEGVLPPAAALEREIAGLGVAEKQKDRARQVFERSAEKAGFFEHGKNRLVLPAIAVKPPVDPKGDGAGSGGEGNGGGGGGGNLKLNLDPLIIELLRKIPSTEEGWPEAKRLRWMRTFAMNVSQIYDAEDAPVELKIEVEKSSNQ